MKKQIRKSSLNGGASIVVLSILLASGASAAGLPTHGHFVSGQGTIAKANQSLTVKQSSTTGIINWNSFSVGKNSGVTFDNGSGATLNRVTGGNLSRIAGSLHATGSLYLMNGNGVIVSGAGRIVTGGSFAASTGDLSNSAFSEGDKRFGVSSIVNRGSITAGGKATLVGHDVSNSGTIRATRVGLDAERTVAVHGTIIAHDAVSAHAHTIVIGANGVIDASGQTAGRISLLARGTTTVAGTLKAEGKTAGGYIETSGEHVHVANGANISTRAANGKTGTWLIDPQDFIIAASGGDITGAELSSELADGAVIIRSYKGSESGDGDIFVNDAVSWSSDRALTLDAFHSIQINAAMSATGHRGRQGGRLILKIDDGGTGGDVTQTAPITAHALALLGAGDFDLTDTSNDIFVLAGNVGSLELSDAKDALYTAAPFVEAVQKIVGLTVTGGLTITTTGNFTSEAPVTAGTAIDITADGNISSAYTGGRLIAPTVDIVAGGGMEVSANTATLTGSSGGAAQLDGNIQTLAGFDAGGNQLLVSDDSGLTVTGKVSASTMTLQESGIFCNSNCTPTDLTIDGKLKATTVALQSAAQISESPTAAIYAKTLSVESLGGAITLTSTHNKVAKFGQIDHAYHGNHAIQFTDDHALRAMGDIGMGTGKVTIKTVGVDHNLNIDFRCMVGDGGVVTLATTGEATENASAIIDASTLNVTANTGIELTSDRNNIGSVGTDTTNSGPNDITQ